MKEQKKKILICCNAYPPNFIGGAELIAHSQAKALNKSGHDVVVFTGDTHAGGDRYSIKQETYDNLTVYRVRLFPQDYRSDFINFSHQIVEEHFKALLDKFSPEVVHFHNIIGLSIGIIHIAKTRGIRTVLTLHDHWGFCYKNTIIKINDEICHNFSECADCMHFIHDQDKRGIPMHMRTDFLAMQMHDVDIFISPSQYLAEAYIRAGLPKEKFRVIPYGIEIQKFKLISKDKSLDGSVRFTFVGYLGRHKGLHTLLRALLLLDKKDRFKVNLVGDGELADFYRQQVKSDGLQNIVKFWGKVDNNHIDEVYRVTDVLILPSIWPENQPVTITEAMASKTPVIASSMGGIPELIEDGKTGYIFETGNVKELAEKMQEFILHPHKLQTFGQNAFEKIAEYELENQVTKIALVYNEDSPNIDNQLENEMLIVCIGKHVNPQCALAMDVFLKEQRQYIYRFVMSEWLSEDQFITARILWIVDREFNRENLTFGLKNKIPLLVPENNKELKNLCVKWNSGLFYKDALEAEECLEYLLSNDNERKILGENGSRILTNSKKN